MSKINFERIANLKKFMILGTEASLLSFPSKNLKKLVPEQLLNPPRSVSAFREMTLSTDHESNLNGI